MPRAIVPSAPILLTALVLLATGPASNAATPHQIADLASGSGTTRSSEPRGWIEDGDRAFFVAEHRFLGPELFVTDGTAAGTLLLADSVPAPFAEPPVPLGMVGEQLLYWTWVGDKRPFHELLGTLWASDGSPAGTGRILPAGVGMLHPKLREATATLVGSTLYFVGCTLEECSLWTSDGTPEGTRARHPFASSRGAEEIAVADGRVVYVADDDLWSFEPGEGATLLLEHVDGREPTRQLAAVGARVLFSAADSSGTLQIWATDGTPEGTRPVSSFPATARFADWRAVEGPHLFLAVELASGEGYEIWRSDGTPGGTVQVTAFPHPRALDFDLSARDVAIVGQRLFVIARTGPLASTRSVWATDGTPESTRLLMDCPESCLLTRDLAVAGDRVLFAVRIDDRRELWSTDGTAGGTGLVAGLCGGPCLTEGLRFDRVGSDVGFAIGGRAWISDGTVDGTRPITPADGVTVDGSAEIGRAGSCWLFPGEDHRGIEPWCSEGAPGSARLLRDIDRSPASSDPREAVPVGDLVVFSAQANGAARHVWASDGRPGSSWRLTEVTSGVSDRRIVGGDGFALFTNPQFEEFLWRTDGTGRGTVPVGALYWANDLLMTTYRGRVYAFGTVDDEAGFWEVDATGEAPRLVFPLPELFDGASYPTVVADAIYFHRGQPRSLWRSDGTEKGTWKVGTPPSGKFLPQQPAIAALDGLVYFVVRESESRRDELWRTDGSPDSIEFVAPFPEGIEPARTELRTVQKEDERPSDWLHSHRDALYYAGSGANLDRATRRQVLMRWTEADGFTPLVTADQWIVPAVFRNPFVGLGDEIFFPFDDGIHGRELWRSDGTPAGTRMVADLHAGGSSLPAEITAVGDRLYFAANSEEVGRELWRLDPDGTVHLTGDIAPGPFSSNPVGLTVAGDTLFFSADDGETGRELWALPLGDGPVPPAPPSGPWLEDPAAPGFRFKVRITSQAGSSLAGGLEPDCIPETLCVSGAVPGRSEVFLRVVGPRPNGYLWPTLVKFSTSRVEVWVAQEVPAGVGQRVRYYDLAPAAPGFDLLTGLFDRNGFEP